MIVLYPIKPVYVDRILSGDKVFELRKKLPRQSISKIVIYSTSPISRVVGMADVKGIHTSTPESIWNLVSGSAGITEEDYFDYFSNSDVAHAIEIDNVKKFVREFEITELQEGISVPQSFCYLDEKKFKKILRRKVVEI